MPANKANNERIKKAQERIRQKRDAGAGIGIPAPRGTRRDAGREKPINGDGDQNPKVSRDSDSGQGVGGAVVSLPNTPEAWESVKTRVEEGMEIFRKSPLAPDYAKPGPVKGFFLRRIGKRIGGYLTKKEIKPVSEQEVTQAKKYNLSTGTMKSIVATVAMLTALAGGIMGKQILVDEQSIMVAAESLYQAYLGVLSVIAAITFVVRFIQNVYKNWGRITEHGVKVSGPNVDLAFDFAPKDEQQ